ncbi:hypothetical protein HN873_047923, partial [Arachis hypogaea]
KKRKKPERLSSQFSLQTRNLIAATFKLQNACQSPPLSPPTVTALSKVCSALSKVKPVVIVGLELQIFFVFVKFGSFMALTGALQLSRGLLSSPSLTHVRFSSAFLCFVSVLSLFLVAQLLLPLILDSDRLLSHGKSLTRFNQSWNLRTCSYIELRIFFVNLLICCIVLCSLWLA